MAASLVNLLGQVTVYDVILFVVQTVMLGIFVSLCVASLWALWANPPQWFFGALAGAVLVGLAWAAVGSVVVWYFTDEADPEFYLRRVSAAWSFFITVLCLLSLTGGLIGGFAASFLFGELPSEKTHKRQRQAKSTHQPATQKTATASQDAPHRHQEHAGPVAKNEPESEDPAQPKRAAGSQPETS